MEVEDNRDESENAKAPPRKESSVGIMESDQAVACLADIETLAEKVLSKVILDFCKLGANSLSSLRENRESFQR